ncbi:DUF1707 domain-containing protein [Streptomyces sp. NPDC052396]|uniref:DUF1707 domain-containing protein n=1 Tax=Streptomyces sp. NPDC052396 TaxID=3365689 RepID=UPI0037D1046B
MTAVFPQAAPWSEQRASHADRESAVGHLQRAAVEGRLDFDELDERLEQALNARTHGELAALLADLQGLEGQGHGQEVVRDGPLVLKGGMHGVVRRGRWKVPPRLTAYGGMGGVVLDFTQVECPLRSLDIEVHGQMAGVTIVIPDNWSAETDGVESGLGGVKDRTTPDHSPDTPLVRLSGTAGLAGVVIRHPKARERRRLERELKAIGSR